MSFFTTSLSWQSVYWMPCLNASNWNSNLPCAWEPWALLCSVFVVVYVKSLEVFLVVWVACGVVWDVVAWSVVAWDVAWHVVAWHVSWDVVAYGVSGCAPWGVVRCFCSKLFGSSKVVALVMDLNTCQEQYLVYLAGYCSLITLISCKVMSCSHHTQAYMRQPQTFEWVVLWMLVHCTISTIKLYK